MTNKRFSIACAITFLILATPIWAQPGFSLSASPSKVYLNEAGSATTTITIKPSDGFTGSVSFTVAGMPQGVSATFYRGSTAHTRTLLVGDNYLAATGGSTLTVTGVSGSLTATVSITLAISAATAPPFGHGYGTVVDLSPYYNVSGIYTDGTPFSTGGLDGVGWAYSENLLTPSRIDAGIQFNFGPANAPDAVSGTGLPMLLPPGQFGHLVMLATGVEGNQTSQYVKVHYTDGTYSVFELNFSDWFTPQFYPDEYEAVTMPYRDTAGGGQDSRGNFYLYEHFFPLDNTKTVESLTLTKNRDVVILAATLTEQ
jgi:hypothetical protein